MELKKIQESLKKIHKRDFEDAVQAFELIENHLKDGCDEAVQTGLICL